MRMKKGRGLLVLAGLLLLQGCATGLVLEGPGEGSEGGLPEQTDCFQVAQEAAGLQAEVRHPPGAALWPKQAHQLLEQWTKAPVTQRSLAPRRVLSWLLGGVLEGGERVEYDDLRWRAERFMSLVWVRPDGYLVDALTGMPLQRLGPLQLREGQWWVGQLLVGDFYFSRSGVFYPVTEALRSAGGPPLAELGVGHPLTAAMDGVQDAVGEMAVALGQSVLHPIRSMEDLAQLPTTVASLIAASPEYFARYGNMSREDQIREAARLSTHLLMLRGGGGAVGAVGYWGGLGAEVPLVSLSAEGALVLGRAVVAGGAMTATLGVEVGALSVVHMAARGPRVPGGGSPQPAQAQSKATPGPGKWTYKTPTTHSPRALEYQEQVTRQPAWRVYMVGDLEFDGFTGLELLEAKGVGYKHFLTKDGTAQPWFRSSKGFHGLMKQADKQSKLAQRLNLRLVWHVAEEEFANFLRKAFKQRQLNNIDVRYTPPQ